MIVRGVDGDNDWFYGKGKNDYKTDLAAIEQSLTTRLNSFLGDCFFDVTAGIDWFNLLGSKNQLGLELAISATILNTPSITSLEQLSVSVNRTTRLLTIQYLVETSLGPIAGTVVVV